VVSGARRCCPKLDHPGANLLYRLFTADISRRSNSLALARRYNYFIKYFQFRVDRRQNYYPQNAMAFPVTSMHSTQKKPCRWHSMVLQGRWPDLLYSTLFGATKPKARWVRLVWRWPNGMAYVGGRTYSDAIHNSRSVRPGCVTGQLHNQPDNGYASIYRWLAASINCSRARTRFNTHYIGGTEVPFTNPNTWFMVSPQIATNTSYVTGHLSHHYPHHSDINGMLQLHGSVGQNTVVKLHF